MRGPISEAVIIVILGFLIGGMAAAVIHFMTDSKWPPAAAPYAGSAATLLTKDEARRIAANIAIAPGASAEGVVRSC